MKKSILPVLLLLSLLIAFLKKRQGFFSLTNNTAKTNTHLEVPKFSSCTIILNYDDGSTPYKKIINNGTDVITVQVKNASPLVASSSKLIYAEGKPACDLYDDTNHLIGHIDIQITMTICGQVEHAQALKDFQNIIIQQITNQITI